MEGESYERIYHRLRAISNARIVNIDKILQCIEQVTKICANIEKILSDLPTNERNDYAIYLNQYTNIKLQLEERLNEFQFDRETNYIDIYKFFYKALNSSNFNNEDLDRWMNVVKKASTKIEQILTEEKDIFTSKKSSLEKSCSHFFTIQRYLDRYVKKGGDLTEASSQANVQWQEVESAFKSRIKTGIIINLNHLDFKYFMEDAQEIFKVQIKKALDEFDSLKVNTALAAQYAITKADVEIIDVKQFNTKNTSIFKTTDLDECFKEHFYEPLDKLMADFQEQGSGWSLKSILHLAININKLNPFRVGCHIELPKDIADKKACINVKNKDNQCFKWAILAALNTIKRNPHRWDHYKKIKHSLKFPNEFPLKISDIPKFEKLNPDVSVNVYFLKKYGDKHEVFPLHLTSNRQKDNHANLLLVQDHYDDEKEKKQKEEDDYTVPEYHFAVIRDISRLLSSQISKNEKKCFVCERCFAPFWNEEKLRAHEIDCATMNFCKIVLPDEKNKILKFENYNRKERVPCVIYADYESLIKPREEDQNQRIRSNHQELSVGYYVKYSFDDSLSEYKSYRQLNEDMKTPSEWFVENLKEIAEKVESIYEDIQPMNLSQEEEENFLLADKCHICNRKIREEDVKVRDHCHLTGW